jgi:hypothetical protein
MKSGEKLRKSTVYLEPALCQALKEQAADTSRTVSALINEAVRESLWQDRADLAAFEERAQEPTVSFEELLKRLN